MGGERVHELKTWPEPFQAMADGLKRFEWRRDDRGYAVGDLLRLREWDPAPDELLSYGAGYRPTGYTGRELRFRVTYLLAGRFGVPDDYVCMSVEPVPAREDDHG